MRSYTMDMTTGSIPVKMIAFAVPLILTNVLQLLFSIVDAIVVGRFAGREALAAVGSTAALVSLFVSFFIGVSIGVNAIAAREFGARDDDALARTVRTSFALALIGGALLALLGQVLAVPLLRMTNTPEDVLPQASSYVRIYFLGAPALVVYNFGAALLRAIGDTRRPFVYLLIAGIINIPLNIFFVVSCGMDASGVALATVISQLASAALVVRCLMHSEGALKLSPLALRLDRDVVRAVMTIGLPAGFQTIIFNISNTLIQASINTFGSTAVAGDTMSANIESLIYAATYSVYSADLSFTSQNFGAGKIDRINKILISSMMISSVLALALSFGSILARRPLLSLFTSDESVMEFGYLRMFTIMPGYFLCSIMDDFVGSMRGIGRSLLPMCVSLFGVCALRLLWIATVFQLSHTLFTLYIVYPISWTVTLTMHGLCYIRSIRALRAAQPSSTG